MSSLSARRAWIEILASRLTDMSDAVALRKESVDRNARIMNVLSGLKVALRKESVDRNLNDLYENGLTARRSPQGERG